MDKYQHRMLKMGGSEGFPISEKLFDSSQWELPLLVKNPQIVEHEALPGRKPAYSVVLEDGTVLLDEIGEQYRYIHRVLANNAHRNIQQLRIVEDDDAGIEYGAYAVTLYYEQPNTVGQNPNLPLTIVLDTETTGLDPYEDEILQLCIIDDKKKIVLNEYYKPDFVLGWPEAELVHGISPRKVADKKNIREDVPLIQEIFDNAQEILIYNAAYNLAFLAELGITVDLSKIVHVMRRYGQAFHNRDYYELEQACKEQKYIFYRAHNALSDCKATLYMYKRALSRERAIRNAPKVAWVILALFTALLCFISFSFVPLFIVTIPCMIVLWVKFPIEWHSTKRYKRSDYKELQ